MKKTTSKVGEAVKTKQPPRTSPSAKMSLNHLRPPAQMKIPSRVDLRQSTVDESILGVWSKRPFKKGEVFGPFMGKKVMDATEDMDPSYVWEIVDKETKEFLFYIDATDLNNANWMRYINCARHFDEQNIISEQIDVDIFYKVIKDIPPGEELLTWYKKPKLRKKPNRKRQLSCASNSGSGEKIPKKAEKSPVKADRTPGKADRTPGKADRTPGKADRTPVKADRTPVKADRTPVKADRTPVKANRTPVKPDRTPGKVGRTPGKADRTPGKNDKPLRRSDKTPRKVIKTPVKAVKHSSPSKDDVRENGVTGAKVKVKVELRRDGETPERDNVIVVKTPPKKALKLTRTRVPASRRRKSRSGRDGQRRVPATVVVKPEDGQAESLVNGCFQFIMKDYHVVKGRSGRRLYRCDICGSVYRHAFSLKRHYIRSHINYFFVSKMDRLNCNVSAPEDAVTFGDMVNFADEDDLGDGDLGEDGVSCEGRDVGTDVKTEQGVVAQDEPVCKRRKESSSAEEVESCDSIKSDGVDADKMTDGDGASPSGNSAVDDKMETEDSTSDEKESVVADEENKSVGTAEEKSSSTVDCASGVSDPQTDAQDEDADVCSAADENKSVTVKSAPCSNGASDGASSVVDDKFVNEKEATNEPKSVVADRDNKSVDAPEEKSSSTANGASGVSDSPNSALHKDTDVCNGSAVKSASCENKPSILDQPSNKKTPGTANSTVTEGSAPTAHSAADEDGTDSETCARDKELNSSDKDNVKNSAADEKISKGNGAPNENKLSSESGAGRKDTQGKISAPPTVESTENATPHKGQGHEDDILHEGHGEANGMADTESDSTVDGKKSAGVDKDDKSVGAPDESVSSPVDDAPDIGDSQSRSVGNVEHEESSAMSSKTGKCSSGTTDSAADSVSTTEQKNNDSAADDHNALHRHDNAHNASNDNCDISSELQDKRSDVVCDASDVTKQSDDGSTPLTSNGIALVYRCHICHRHLGTKLHLKQHLVDHSQNGVDEKSEDARAFACDQCEMTFLSVQNLARHQTVHSGEKPFVCRYCDKKFPTVTNQRRHERIHQGRRFCCGHCQRSFTQTGDLKKHISKLHPELFHECVLCGKYFGSDDQLEEHLGSHGNGVRQNWKAVSMQRGTHRANLELDRAESMKLAPVKTGAKFACTICRKLFDDYANMCRHRRLAHQRSSILNVRMGRSANRCCVAVETPGGGNDDPSGSIDAEESEDAFYARIAENISDNLTNFLEGKKVHLDNCYDHINEKLRPSSEPAVSQRRRRSSSDITRINVAQYNFPKTFRLRSSRAIENCGRQDGVNEKDKTDDTTTEQKPSEGVTSTDGAKSTDRSADAELMHVPKVRQCVQCRRNFHTFQSYREHMYIRHKTLVPDDANKSEDWRNEQPSSPPEHDRIAAPLLSHKLLNNSTDMPPASTPTNKSKLSYSGWKNGLLTGVRKDVCSVGDGVGDTDSCEVLDVCDLLVPDDEPSKDADKPFNYKLNLVARCYICNVCNEQFNCFDSLVDHQYDLHPNVNCTHLEVAVDGRPASWLLTEPVGLLRVTTNHVPAVEDFKRSAKAKFRCTKCNQPFASMLELHTHITECASEGVPVIVEPPRVVKKSTKYKVKTVKGRKKIRPSSPTLPLSPGYETFRADDLDASHDTAQDRQAQRKKRRKNFELLYNPLHHVRRRELTQVLEIHNCGGCHQQFETISMLERHVRICKEKDKLKELRAISASLDANVSVDDDEDDEYAYDPTKHMCIYCLRQFTYLGMLRKHVSEWCQVRQDFIDHGELLDNEWEDILEVKGRRKEGRLSRQSSCSSLNGVADSQDVEEGSKKGMQPKWGTKWKCRSKQVDEPAVRLESESSTDSFIEPRQSEESRADDVESSQESHECSKQVEATSNSADKDHDDGKDKPFSRLLKPNGSVDEPAAAGGEKDISES